ncbi:MAG: hypothetical protein CR991_04145 [Proteobacteria bacterium]|nr:MAG: hypothetical protein CR991_04145 [Pseudomonadota bacterium]
MLQRFICFIYCVLCAGLVACAHQPDERADLRFDHLVSIDAVSVQVAVFETAAERALGLMNITTLPTGTGALFVFEQEGEVNFWMKNTLIPLDMLFFDHERRLVHVVRAVQPCRLADCEKISVLRTQYVIEVSPQFNGLQDLVLGKSQLELNQ